MYRVRLDLVAIAMFISSRDASRSRAPVFATRTETICRRRASSRLRVRVLGTHHRPGARESTRSRARLRPRVPSVPLLVSRDEYLVESLELAHALATSRRLFWRGARRRAPRAPSAPKTPIVRQSRRGWRRTSPPGTSVASFPSPERRSARAPPPPRVHERRDSRRAARLFCRDAPWWRRENPSPPRYRARGGSGCRPTPRAGVPHARWSRGVLCLGGNRAGRGSGGARADARSDHAVGLRMSRRADDARAEAAGVGAREHVARGALGRAVRAEGLCASSRASGGWGGCVRVGRVVRRRGRERVKSRAHPRGTPRSPSTDPSAGSRSGGRTAWRAEDSGRPPARRGGHPKFFK